MAYTPLLGLTLPVNGTLAGTWGDVINAEITSLLDSAVAGTTSLPSNTDVTLDATVSTANEARAQILLCTGVRSSIKTIIAPARSKTYIVINSTTGGFGVKVVGVGPTAGVTIENGERAVIAWNGSDFVKAATTNASSLTGTLAVANGGTGVTTSTGTGSTVLSISPTFTGVPLAPTATVGTNTTQLATTAFVAAAVAGGTAGVASFSAGTTGLTPATATTGAVVLAGTLAVANGGTGVTTSTGTGSNVLSANPVLTGTATGFTVGALNGYSTATNPTTGQTLFPIKTGTTTYALQTTTLSTSAPSGGVAGDVWYRYA